MNEKLKKHGLSIVSGVLLLVLPLFSPVYGSTPTTVTLTRDQYNTLMRNFACSSTIDNRVEYNQRITETIEHVRRQRQNHNKR